VRECVFVCVCVYVSVSVCVCVCVCSVNYPACNAHAPHCHLWPASLYNIPPHYLMNGTVFEKELLSTKCAFLLPLRLLSETFHMLRRNE